MTRVMFGALNKRLQWMRYRRELAAMTNLEQFHAFMHRVQDASFQHLENCAGMARKEIVDVLQELQFGVRDKTFLDIGPGYGSTIDVVRGLGAKLVEFVEYNPLYYTFNRLKGFDGYQLDVRKHLDRVPKRRFDFIWIKATYVADGLNLPDGFSFKRMLFRYPQFEFLLAQIEQLATSGGYVVFCPHWLTKGSSRQIDDYMRCDMTRRFQSRAYTIMPPVEGHNILPQWPLTFVKQVS